MVNFPLVFHHLGDVLNNSDLEDLFGLKLVLWITNDAANATNIKIFDEL
jgi:hypothetical protein